MENKQRNKQKNPGKHHSMTCLRNNQLQKKKNKKKKITKLAESLKITCTSLRATIYSTLCQKCYKVSLSMRMNHGLPLGRKKSATRTRAPSGTY